MLHCTTTSTFSLQMPESKERNPRKDTGRIHGALIRKVKSVAGELFYSGKLAPTHLPHGGSSSSSSSVRIMEQRWMAREPESERDKVN